VAIITIRKKKNQASSSDAIKANGPDDAINRAGGHLLYKSGAQIQGDYEGSCMTASFARMLMIANHVQNGVVCADAHDCKPRAKRRRCPRFHHYPPH
jgi:hypothetical protein